MTGTIREHRLFEEYKAAGVLRSLQPVVSEGPEHFGLDARFLYIDPELVRRSAVAIAKLIHEDLCPDAGETCPDVIVSMEKSSTLENGSPFLGSRAAEALCKLNESRIAEGMDRPRFAMTRRGSKKTAPIVDGYAGAFCNQSKAVIVLETVGTGETICAMADEIRKYGIVIGAVALFQRKPIDMSNLNGVPLRIVFPEFFVPIRKK